jgi:hypothetical protein
VFRHSLVLAIVLLLPLQAGAENPPPHWIVVTAPAFRAAVEPLGEHRKADGMKVVVVQTTDVLGDKEIRSGDAKKLAEHVQGLSRQAKGACFVLLVGAVEPGKLTDPEKKVVPALRGTIGRMQGQPSDNGYGCPGGERLPSVAVGRLPARSDEEARRMVQKILAFERDARPGEWRQRITVLAGIPEFNPVVDRLVESMALRSFAKLDHRWTARAIYHNQNSRFCVPDEQLHDKALDYVQQGQAFTLYMGHSWAGGFHAPNTRFLDRRDWEELKIPRGPGILVSFGCHACQLCGEEGEGYGVAAIRNPQGPVAATGAHGICFAAMCQLAADGVLDSVGPGKDPERLADVWLKLKEGIARGKIDPITFRLLDSVDGDSKIPQETQRHEHLEMFLLLGDPALRLPRIAENISLQVGGDLTPGAKIRISGKLPERLQNARVRLTLERPLTSEPADLEQLPREGPADRRRIMLANHDRANRFDLLKQELTATGTHFQTEWQVPAKLSWPTLLVRAYASTDRHEALGVLAVEVKPPPEK